MVAICGGKKRGHGAAALTSRSRGRLLSQSGTQSIARYRPPRTDRSRCPAGDTRARLDLASMLYLSSLEQWGRLSKKKSGGDRGEE